MVLSLTLLLDSTALNAATSSDYYKAGQQLYDAKNYSQAVSYFGAAIQLDPGNMAAYEGRANCYYALGNQQAALADYQKVQSVKPDPQVAQMIQTLQAQAPLPSLQTAAFPQKKDTTFNTNDDVRITFGTSLMTLTDFNNNNQGFNSVNQNLVVSGGIGKTYTGTLPGGLLPQLGIEVSRRFTPDWEGGLFFSYLPVGTVTNYFAILSGSIPIFYSQDSYNITSFFAGVQGRYTFSHGDLRPFVSAALMAVPMQISYSSTDLYFNSSTSQLDLETLNGTFASLGFGGQAQVGLDWELWGDLAVSASVGYQAASASHFQTTLNDNLNGTTSQVQNPTMDVVQTDFGYAIVPVSNGNLARMIYTKNGNLFIPPGTPATNPTPMIVDLSGMMGTCQVSYNF